MQHSRRGPVKHPNQPYPSMLRAPQPVEALAGELVQHRVRARVGQLEIQRLAQLRVCFASGGRRLRRLGVAQNAAPGAVTGVPARQG